MSCGKYFTERNIGTSSTLDASKQNNKYIDTFLYTAYLGRIKAPVLLTKDTNIVSLECSTGKCNDIILRVINAAGKFSYNNPPPLSILSNTMPVNVNIRENIEVYYQIQLMELQKAKDAADNISFEQHQKYYDKFIGENLPIKKQLEKKFAAIKYDPEILRMLYVKNSCVDIHFQTYSYLAFLRQTLCRDSINNGKLLLSVFNVDKLDNAYFTGEYMVYGNGAEMFYPLTSIDVSAHELTHGLVQSTAGLEYLGHSGALNESFADVFGTAFEHWIYKINENKTTDDDLNGEFDWLIGEDIGKSIKYLRNMRDPNKADSPQPKTYRGPYWANPNNEQFDCGGVHINSGVGNYVFYQFTQVFGMYKSLSIFYNSMLRMSSNSDYIDFRNLLLEYSDNKDAAKKCLDEAGLTDNAVSDWNKSPTANRNPIRDKNRHRLQVEESAPVLKRAKR